MTYSWKEIKEHNVVTDFLNENSLVLDCGACVGEFSKPILDEYGCQFVLIEPDPRNFRKLIYRFNGNPHISLRNRAVSDKEGEIDFYLGNFITASSIYSSHRGLGNIVEKVKSITLNSLLEKYDKVDLLKLDLEGAEKSVIPNTKPDLLKKVKQIIVEYHQQANIDDYTQEDVDRCREYIKDFGFEEVYYGRAHPNAGYDSTYINKEI